MSSPQPQFQTAGAQRPRELTYIPIPGPWRRKEKPDWPESVFQIPTDVPDGTIYYVTKGRWIGQGNTAHIELLPSGHIIKYPKSNPYYQQEEEENRDRIRLEATVYERLQTSLYIPKLIHWDPDSCSLTLEYLENGSLEAYVKKHVEIVTSNNQVINHVPIQVRRRWAAQAARALADVHASQVVHCDVTPRNFLLNVDLDLRISDFAGCSISGSPPLIAPGPRYLPPGWSWKRQAVEADDIFALGSLLYFIIVGVEPYADLEEDQVQELFEAGKFPDVDQLCGEIVRGCWDGSLSSAKLVVDALDSLEWEANIEQQS